ncbi:MAG TPA: DUF3343 domain-containing protein [Candidatus Dorea gallistercoris]|uniref:DUF3343 domain-containing protein n=1 Tax=Candidatus Dorea gallistercoris TaxID=2838542 RepID=A0A9D1RBU5_9FIRM|nr:DUF3343 domain-containing protein [Candidatus Dorea gallistercoris]
MDQIQHYVLFPNHDNGMRLYQELKKLGVKAVIAPTPRSASKCCGISLIVQEEDLDQIQECILEHEIEILKIVAIERDINANRDRYC